MSYRPRRRSLVASRGPYHQGFRPLAPNHPAPRLSWEKPTRAARIRSIAERVHQSPGRLPAVIRHRDPRRQPLLPHRPPLRPLGGTQVLRRRESRAAARLGRAVTAAIRDAGVTLGQHQHIPDDYPSRRDLPLPAIPQHPGSTSISGSRNWPATSRHNGVRRARGNSFGPYRASRPAASAEDSPPTGATATRAARSATVSQPVAKDPPVIPLPCPTAFTEARAGRPGLRCPWSRPASRPSGRCSSPYAR